VNKTETPDMVETTFAHRAMPRQIDSLAVDRHGLSTMVALSSPAAIDPLDSDAAAPI
jgi:hypothetical protein